MTVASYTSGLRAAATALGPAFGGFLAMVAETARARQADAVWFLSSEGHWFASAYRQLTAALGDGFPPARHLAISRRASFLPSLERVDAASLAPLLAQYTTTSLGGVLASLGLEPDAVCGLDATAPWTEQAGQALQMPAFIAAAEQRRGSQRELLLRYLAQQGLPSRGEAFVADIGWRGSIQDNLCRLLPELRIHGAYFLLLPAFSAAPPNASRQSFLQPDARQARRLRFGAPLELAVGCHGGSAIGYLEAEQDVVPHEGPPPACAPVEQARMIVFRSMLTEAAVAEQAPPAAALRLTLRFLEHPPRAFLAPWFAHERDESFGTGRRHHASARLKARDLLAAPWDSAARQRFGRALAESGWPWALLRRDLPFLLPLLRALLSRLDMRLDGAPRPLAAAPRNAATGGSISEFAR